MIAVEEFEKSGSWAFMSYLSEPLFAASRPYNPASGEYEVTGPDPDKWTLKQDFSCKSFIVKDQNAAYEALVSQFAVRASLVFANRVGSSTDTADFYLDSFRTEQSGFKPGTFDPWSYRRWFHLAISHPDFPDEMLMATTSYMEEDDRKVHIVQVKRADGHWRIVPRTAQFERLLEESCCQWAIDGLEIERAAMNAPAL